MSIDRLLARMQRALQIETAEELAQALGKDVTTFRVWRSRGKVPDSVINLVSRQSGKTVAWLLEEEVAAAPPSLPSKKTSSFFREKEKQINPQAIEDELVHVPEIDVRMSTGNGEYVHQEEVIKWYPFPRSWLRQKGVDIDSLAMARSKGDSMLPTIANGELMLIDRSVERIVSDGIYLIEQGNQLQCKRLQADWTGGVTILSDNPKYPPKTLTAEQAESLRVVGRIVI